MAISKRMRSLIKAFTNTSLFNKKYNTKHIESIIDGISFDGLQKEAILNSLISMGSSDSLISLVPELKITIESTAPNQLDIKATSKRIDVCKRISLLKDITIENKFIVIDKKLKNKNIINIITYFDDELAQRLK